MSSSEFQVLRDLIAAHAEQYKYRPLPKELGQATRQRYSECLNGFDQFNKKPVKLCETLIALNYERIVIGDYGAYLEISPEDFVGVLTVPDAQRWRLNGAYIRQHSLTPKYQWYETLGVKVYKQLGTVRYADYRVGFYYISVLDLD